MPPWVRCAQLQKEIAKEDGSGPKKGVFPVSDIKDVTLLSREQDASQCGLQIAMQPWYRKPDRVYHLRAPDVTTTHMWHKALQFTLHEHRAHGEWSTYAHHSVHACMPTCVSTALSRMASANRRGNCWRGLFAQAVCRCTVRVL